MRAPSKDGLSNAGTKLGGLLTLLLKMHSSEAETEFGAESRPLSLQSLGGKIGMKCADERSNKL
jgi:hypothetical protein